MVPDELSEGPRFAAFCEHYLRHTKGRWARRPLVLEPWQREFWWEALELDPTTNRRIYREVGMGLPRKNGKSTVAAGRGLYGLVAEPEAEPEVYVGAAAQQQAGIVMGQSLKMARASVMLAPYVRVQKYLIEGIPNGGIMRALSSDGALQHGLNPSLAIIDEVHAHKNADLFIALTTGTGAREQPQTFWITTAGVDEEGLLNDLYGQMATGPGDIEQRGPYLTIYRDKVNGVLVWWYGAPRDADVEDPSVWSGCNPASWLNDGTVLAKEYATLRQKGMLLEWRIYHLNQIMGQVESWLPDGAWEARAEGEPTSDPWHGLDDALPVGVGIERTAQGGAAAVVVSQRQGERVVVRSKVYKPAATGRVNAEELREDCRALRQRFQRPMVRDPKTRLPIHGPAFAFDYVFTESAEALEQDGLNMVTFAQTATTMGPASTLTYELVTTGRLVHDGDPVLARHVADTTAILTERGMKVTKNKRQSNSAAIALVMSVAMAMQDSPAPYVRKPRQARSF